MTWDDRDKAIKAGLETFSNGTAPKVAANKQARIGRKVNHTFWFGYKEHVSVDIQICPGDIVSWTSMFFYRGIQLDLEFLMLLGAKCLA